MNPADSFYDVVDPRRKQEKVDSMMIEPDHNAMANLSEKFINKQFNPDKFVEAFRKDVYEID